MPFYFFLSFNSGKSRSRPSSAGSTASTLMTVESELFGGRRMESLMQGLYHEKKAGGFFMGYLEKLGNMVCILHPGKVFSVLPLFC